MISVLNSCKSKNNENVDSKDEIQMQLTESLSYEDQDDLSRCDSGSLDIEMPQEYRNGGRTPSPKKNDRASDKRDFLSPQKNEEDIKRLVMLAKHPNAEVCMQSPEQPRSIRRNLDVAGAKRSRASFSRSGPIDADTGEAWDTIDIGENSNNHRSTFATSLGPIQTAPSEVSFQASDDLEEELPRQPGVLNWMARVLPSFDSTIIDCSASKASKDANQSMSMESETTRRISNVSPAPRKDLQHNFDISESPFEDDSKCGRVLHQRAGVVILLLSVILILAIIVTVVAALSASDRNDEDANNFYVPRDSITFEPISNPPRQTKPPSVSQSLSPKPQPSTPSPTSSPSKRPVISPTRSPTMSPTLSPTRSPTSPPQPTVAPTSTFFGTRLTNLAQSLEGAEFGQRFGYAVALSQNGKILAVGAPLTPTEGRIDAGLVYVYELKGNRWQERGPPLVGRNEEDQFGSSLALSSDGTVLVVSEPTFSGDAGHRSGNVRAFKYAGSDGYRPLGQEISGLAATDHFGIALSLSGDGSRLAVGAPYHDNGESSRKVNGQVQVFEYDGSTWEFLGGPLQGSNHLDWFGWSLDLSDDGDVLVVGAPRNLRYGGYVGCYQLAYDGDFNNEWVPLGGGTILNTLEPTRYDDSFGQAVSLSIDKTTNKRRLAIGSPGKNVVELNSGSVAVYELDDLSNKWNLLGTAVTSDIPGEGHQLGFAVDLQDSLLAVGIPGFDTLRGEVRLYQYDENLEDWQLNPNPLYGKGEFEFGFALQLNPDMTLVVGSAATTGNSTGMANVYRP